MIRLRSFHLRASRYGGQVALRRTSRATADTSLAQGKARLAIMTLAFVVIAGGSSVLACPVCFGAEETSMIDGAKLGVLVMLAITLAVQGGFVAFFLYLRKRAKHIADVDLDTEWSELQGAPKTL
jgi:hypothetical protein